jgi:hypothetical protein
MAEDLFQAAGVKPQGGGPCGPVRAHTRSTKPLKTIPIGSRTLHHATGGLSDKALAALKAHGDLQDDKGVQGDTFSERYRKNLANTRGQIEDYEAANPGWAGAKGRPRRRAWSRPW